MWKVPLFDSDLGTKEKAAVQEVLDSGWLTMGPRTQAFEEAFADFIGTPHAVAVANGTAALHLSLLTLDLQDGDQVICPSLTFSATANAVLHAGGTPVFADIGSLDDLNMAPDRIEACITPRTRAIIVVHYAGYPCDMEAITALAEQHNLKVLEDAAHAPGAHRHQARCGSFGYTGCFSFYSNKNMTTGEGGMITTHDEELAGRLRLLRSHGMTSSAADRHAGRARSYDVVAMGLNYRIDEIRSALGLAQLEDLQARNAKRRQLDALYRDLLADVEEVHLPFSDSEALEGSSCHVLSAILAEDLSVAAFREQLKEEGIQTSHHYPAVHLLEWYRFNMGGTPGQLPMTEAVSDRQVTLPLFPGMTEDMVHQVVEAIRSVLVRGA